MELVRLTAWCFRNLSEDKVCFNPGVNLIIGDNGEGKSNLLEAITVFSGLRSFRTHQMRAVVRHGEQCFRLAGEVKSSSGSYLLEQRVEVGPPLRRQLSLNQAKVSPFQYMQVLPVFALSDSDRGLVTGAPDSRRSFLDRITYLLEPAHYDQLSSYRRLLRQRNLTLTQTRSNTDVTSDEMDVWEEQLAGAGAQVIQRRLRAVQRLQEPFQQIYCDLRGDCFPDVELGYRHESWLDPSAGPENLHKQYKERYYRMRARDCQAGFTGAGPHRHDLKLRVNGRLARDVLSAGQIKVVVAALRLAALAQVEEHRGERCPVIFDDVDAELDRHVLSRLIDHLDDRRQLFLSSAHEEMLKDRVASTSASRMLMRHGVCIEELHRQTGTPEK